MIKFYYLFVPILIILGFSACRETEIVTYEAPIEHSFKESKHSHTHNQKKLAISWKAPSHWEEKEASQMRKASFDIPGEDGVGDLSITSFPGDAGGILPNINRWRNQLGLSAFSPKEMENSTNRIAILDRNVTVMEYYTEDDSKGLLAAILPLDSETWFFKLTGPKSTLENETHSFAQFISSIQLATPSSPHSHHTHNHGAHGHATPAAKIQSSFKIPSNWKGKDLGPMRVASYDIMGENNAQADLSVIPLPGKAGGPVANFNRWRNELGLEPLSEPELENQLEEVYAKEIKGQLIDIEGSMKGSDQKVRTLAAIILKQDTTWFFKMRGSSDLVTQEKMNFISFIKETNLP